MRRGKSLFFHLQSERCDFTANMKILSLKTKQVRSLYLFSPA